jgi:hypothetical protein
MFNAPITLAVLIAAVSLASAPVFARGGGGGGSAGGGGQHASPPANKAAATPKSTTSKILTNSATGKHINKDKIN